MSFFGWSDGVPEADDTLRARHAEAEALTDELVGPAYDVLDDGQSRDLLELLAAARETVDSARTG